MESLQDLNVSEKLFCITGDNAANNSTMAEAIAKQLPQFNSDHNLLGCIGHVLNIAAKRGMDAVGLDWGEYLVRVLDEDRLEIEQEKMMEDSETDDSELEDFHDYSGNESVLKRIRKIVSHMRNSPQKRVQETAITSKLFPDNNMPELPDVAPQMTQTRSLTSATASGSTDADEVESSTRYICYNSIYIF